MFLPSPTLTTSDRRVRNAPAATPPRNFVTAVQRLTPSEHRTFVSAEEGQARERRFEEIFEAHYRAIARYLRTRGHAAADADDLIAGTFEVAWRRLDQLPPGREAVPWLLTVARNLSRNARRKSQREAVFVEGLAPVTVGSTEMKIEDRAASAEVMAALAQLKTIDRDLVLLVAWDELSVAEAGQVLGLRPVTARSRLHRARQRMSALLAGSTASASGVVPASLETSSSKEGS
jgi:RNA polymerase sigma-70 factor (ECF subfamily)